MSTASNSLVQLDVSVSPSILEQLLASARELFQAGPVFVWGDEDEFSRPRIAVATIFESALHTVLRWSSKGFDTKILELLEELWGYDARFDMDAMKKLESTFLLFITNDSRRTIAGLAMVLAADWIIQQLERDADLLRESEHRTKSAEQLLADFRS